MVKFVASDLDGTLLLNGAQSVDELLYSISINLLTKVLYSHRLVAGR